jgi:hypothetical protein
MEFNHTTKEEELIRACGGFNELQNYLDGLEYEKFSSDDDYVVGSFRRTVDLEKGLCLSGALTAAHVLECHGYEPLLLTFSAFPHGHGVAVYQDDSHKWGSVGLSKSPLLKSRRANYNSLSELANSYLRGMTLSGLDVYFRELVKLELLVDVDWRFGSGNLANEDINEWIDSVSSSIDG